MSMKKENKNLERGKRQQMNKKRNPNEPRVLEFNLSKSILVLLIIGMIIGVITTARIIITINEAKQNKALATEDGKNSERVNWVTSSDGKQVPVPKGYVASQIPGETSVNGGFVIYEDTAEGIDWNTILGTAVSTLNLDENTETTTKNEIENNNETITNTETTNTTESTNNNETTNKNEVINNNEETNKNEIINDTEKETNSESTKETEEKKEETENKVTNSETESTTEATTEKKEKVNVEETTKAENTEEVNKTEKTNDEVETNNVVPKGNLNEEEITKNEEETNKVETENKQEENNIENVKSEGIENKETLTNAKIEKATSEEKAVSTKTESTNAKVGTLEEKVTANEQATNIEEKAGAEVQAEATGIEAMAEDPAVNIFNLQKSTNQYVWVPVNDISRICGVDSNRKLWGKLYEMDSSGRSKKNWTETNGLINITDKTKYREPDVTHYNTNFDIDSKLQEFLYGETQYELLAEELERHFYETIESIKKYGGFYIGRYETGGLNGTAVVRKMDTNIANQAWYTMYKRCKELKGENGNVITSMIWGNLWDETLQWLVESGATNSAGTTLTYRLVGYDSTSWGNCYHSTFSYIPERSETGEETNTKVTDQGTRIPAGSSEYTKVNNIYDLAGNVCDRTLEARSTHSRVSRGGNCDNYSDFPADYRDFNNYPTTVYDYYGCRAQLLIK